MKRIFIFLLMAVLAGGLFAQELSVSGDFNTGLHYRGGEGVKDSGDGGLRAVATNHNAESDIIRANLNFNFKSDNIGAKVRLRLNGDDFFLFDPVKLQPTTPGRVNNFYPFVKHAYAWADVLDGLLRIEGGLINSTPWATQGIFNDSVEDGLGLQFIISPIEGLSFGLGAFYRGESYGNHARQRFSDASADLNSHIGYHKYTAGFTYTMADVFGVQGSFALVDAAPDSAIFGISILAVENLTAEIEFRMAKGSNNIADHMWISQMIGFGINDAISVGADICEYLYSDFAFEIWPWFQYSITESIAVGASVGFAMNMNVGTSTAQLGFDCTGFGDNTIPTGAMVIAPGISALFNLGPKTAIDVGFTYYLQIEDPKVNNDVFNIYANFNWAF